MGLPPLITDLGVRRRSQHSMDSFHVKDFLIHLMFSLKAVLPITSAPDRCRRPFGRCVVCDDKYARLAQPQISTEPQLLSMPLIIM